MRIVVGPTRVVLVGPMRLCLLLLLLAVRGVRDAHDLAIDRMEVLS